jgi:hypothetical protein
MRLVRKTAIAIATTAIIAPNHFRMRLNMYSRQRWNASCSYDAAVVHLGFKSVPNNCAAVKVQRCERAVWQGRSAGHLTPLL